MLVDYSVLYIRSLQDLIVCLRTRLQGSPKMGTAGMISGVEGYLDEAEPKLRLLERPQ